MTFRRIFLKLGLPVAVGAALVVHGIVRDGFDATAGAEHFTFLLTTALIVAAIMSAIYVNLGKRLP